MDKGKVVVGWLDDGTCEGGFAESALNLIVGGVMNGLVRSWMRYESGPVMGWARNELAERFLRTTDGDWLLSIDSDMLFEPTLLERLLEVADPEERPIVGPVCYGMTTEKGVFPAVFRMADNRFYYLNELPVDELIRVDGMGMACSMIHRSVFEKMREIKVPGRWYDHLFLGPEPCGEDLSFCLRAKTLGIPIWAHTGIPIRHLKVKLALDRPMWENWKKMKAAEAEAKEDEVVEAEIVGEF